MYNKSNALTITLLIIAILLLGYIAFFKDGNFFSSDVKDKGVEPNVEDSEPKNPSAKPPITGIPTSVKNQYEAMKKQYGNSMGAALEICKKGNEIVYAVSGSGGYVGVSYYYGSSGNLIESKEWSDIVSEDTFTDSFDIKSYSCQIVETSRK